MALYFIGESIAFTAANGIAQYGLISNTNGELLQLRIFTVQNQCNMKIHSEYMEQLLLAADAQEIIVQQSQVLSRIVVINQQHFDLGELVYFRGMTGAYVTESVDEYFYLQFLDFTTAGMFYTLRCELRQAIYSRLISKKGGTSATTKEVTVSQAQWLQLKTFLGTEFISIGKRSTSTSVQVIERSNGNISLPMSALRERLHLVVGCSAGINLLGVYWWRAFIDGLDNGNIHGLLVRQFIGTVAFIYSPTTKKLHVEGTLQQTSQCHIIPPLESISVNASQIDPNLNAQVVNLFETIEPLVNMPNLTDIDASDVVVDADSGTIISADTTRNKQRKRNETYLPRSGVSKRRLALQHIRVNADEIMNLLTDTGTRAVTFLRSECKRLGTADRDDVIRMFEYSWSSVEIQDIANALRIESTSNKKSALQVLLKVFN